MRGIYDRTKSNNDDVIHKARRDDGKLKSTYDPVHGETIQIRRLKAGNMGITGGGDAQKMRIYAQICGRIGCLTKTPLL